MPTAKQRWTVSVIIFTFVLIDICDTQVKERTLQWQQWQRFSNFDNLLDTSFEVWHHVDVSLVICAVHCGESNSCLSFFYHQAYKTCKGVSVEYGNPNELADYANGSKYYKAGNIVSTTPTTTESSTTTPNTTIHSPTTPASGQYCQPNYTLTESICWRLDSSLTTWDGARAICQGEGGDLLMLKNESFLQHIQTYLQTASVVYAGASDLAVEGEWLWVDGTTFSGPWGPGQPNNMGGDQHCIVMETAYGYNFSDVSCFTNYKFLCQTPVLTLSDICISPYNYDSFLDICWRLEDSLTATWQNARNVCMSEGGDLMILESEFVHTYIKGVLPLIGSSVVYVGAYDIAMDNTFTWLDGSPFTGPWGPSQPNNYAMNETSQNCVIMEGLYGYNFSDTQCTSPYNFLCQITAENFVSTPTMTTHSSTTAPSTSLQSSTTETVSPASGTYCQPNYTWTENICWRLDTSQTTWDGARTICQGEGGDLLMLKNESFLQHIQTYLQTVSASFVYAGASDLAVEGEWLWVDGTIFSGPWGPGQPNNMNGNQHCIIMENAYGYNFSDVRCTNNYKFLCQTPVLTLSDICISPYNYDSVLDICWRLEDSFTVTWQNARNICMSDGGDLMILESEAVHTYLKGVLSLVGSAVVYVGAYDIAMDNTFTWLDGSPFTGPWGPSQPNNYAMNETNQNCVIMEGLYGYNFSDTQCTSPYNFLCQIIAENFVSTPTTTTHSSTTTPSTSLQSSTTETVSPASGTYCQPNYTWTENICWRLDTSQTTWDGARTICQGEGGDLLMLKNESFLQHIQTYLQTVSGSNVYAGASDLAVEGEWLWVDGTTFSGPWVPGQPNNMNGNQHCIIMETAYGYNFSDLRCTNNYKFLCQTPVLTLSDICISPYNYDSVLDICWRLEDSFTVTWQNARNICMSDGGDLMILESEAVHTYLKGVLSLVYPPDVFVGASDTDVEGQYTWIDGLPVTGQWGTGHPNNEADLDCVALGKLLSYDFTEVDCMASLSFLCQIKL